MSLNTPTLRIKRLRPEARIPTYGSPGAIGLDLSYLCPRTGGTQLLTTGDWCAYPTGIAVAIPDGYYGRVAPRSGLALRHGIDVLAGVIDSDYRGEIYVILVNHGNEDFWVDDHMRIAQLIIERAARAEVFEQDELPPSIRGTDGFGSTGT